MVLSVEDVYPSIGELMPEAITARLPVMLAEEIRERYSKLGTKYMTDEQHSDGRFINACMNNSSIQDAIEEIVDAVFNTLVWIFKTRIAGHGFNDNAYQVLIGLIEIYALLIAEKQIDGI